MGYLLRRILGVPEENVYDISNKVVTTKPGIFFYRDVWDISIPGCGDKTGYL